MPAARASPLPVELLHLVVEQLSLSHSCRSCFQHDLLALAQVSSLFNALATPPLYSTICLRPHNDESSEEYEQQLQLLLRSLKSSSYLASLVRRVRFAHEEPATEKLWAEIVTHTPNLQVLQGVDVFFPRVEEDESSENEFRDGEIVASNTAEIIANNKFALNSLRGLSDLRQAIVHQETLPCPLSTLLSSWPSLETLVLGDLRAAEWEDDAEASWRDLRAVIPSMKKLKNVYFYDCDLDYAQGSERDALLPILPPLERLGFEYSLGFSLAGICNYLSTSQAHAETLHTLDYHRQLRCRNTLSDITTLLRLAPELKRLSLGLTRFPFDIPDEQPEGGLLASNSLEELRWVPRHVYRSNSVVSGADEFNTLLVNSLLAKSMPNLKLLIVGHEWKGMATRSVQETVFEVYEILEMLESRGIVTKDPKKAAEKGIVLLRLELPEPEQEQEVVDDFDAGQSRVSGYKRGVQAGKKRAACDAGKEEVNEGDVDELDDDAGMEGFWGEGEVGDLVELWIGGRD